MDVLGFVLIGAITEIGGGTTRVLLLGPTVWWSQNPGEVLRCVAAARVTYFWITTDITRKKGMIGSDARGLSVFGVVGCHGRAPRRLVLREPPLPRCPGASE